PRRRDRRDRPARRAHRPPGALHPAHQRRADLAAAPDRHGRRALPGGQRPERRAGPASGAPGVRALPRGAHATGTRAALAGAHPRRRAGGPALRAWPWLPPLPQHRLPGAHRRLRAAGGQRRHGRRAAPQRPAGVRRRGPRPAPVPPAGRRGAGLRPGRTDQHRRGVPRQRQPQRGLRLMAAFRFTGRDAQGQKVAGVRQAASAEALAGELLAERITPLTIEAQAEAGASDATDALRQLKRLLGRERVSLEELIIFCRQMHSLSKAGVPILRAMGGLADSARNPYFGEVLRAVRADLAAGNGLGVALSSHPKVFAPLFISMVSVGENTGQRDLAFKQLAGYLDMERETRKRIQQATRYPLFVLLAMGVALVVINLLVIPAFSKVFAQFKSELPLPTRLLI